MHNAPESTDNGRAEALLEARRVDCAIDQIRVNGASPLLSQPGRHLGQQVRPVVRVEHVERRVDIVHGLNSGECLSVEFSHEPPSILKLNGQDAMQEATIVVALAGGGASRAPVTACVDRSPEADQASGSIVEELHLENLGAVRSVLRDP